MLNEPKQARGRPKGPDTKPETLRLPVELVERIDQFIAMKSAQMPGFTIIRAEAIRLLLSVGLDKELSQ